MLLGRLAAQGLGSRVVARVVRHTEAPGARQLQGNRAADATGAAGDEYFAAREAEDIAHRADPAMKSSRS
jgi:hypothetical protein